MQNFNANRPYLIVTVILVGVLYCGLVVWIALRPSDVLAHDEKVFCLLMLILLPGRYALEWVFNRFGLGPRLQKRLSGMAFVGLLVGLLRATDSSGILSSGVTFLVAFAAASLAFLVLDFCVDWLWSRWKNR